MLISKVDLFLNLYLNVWLCLFVHYIEFISEYLFISTMVSLFSYNIFLTLMAFHTFQIPNAKMIGGHRHININY